MSYFFVFILQSTNNKTKQQQTCKNFQQTKNNYNKATKKSIIIQNRDFPTKTTKSAKMLSKCQLLSALSVIKTQVIKVNSFFGACLLPFYLGSWMAKKSSIRLICKKRKMKRSQ
jgi:hypothetical protein